MNDLRDQPEQWPVTASRVVWEGPWVVSVRSDLVHAPGEPEEVFDRQVVVDPGAVVILALDESERAVVIRQYRHPVGMRLVQLPAGKLDVAGEDPLRTAQRELVEEAGYQADHWEHLLTTWASPGITTESHAIYLATGLREVGRPSDPAHEEAHLTVEMVPVSELVTAVLDGRVQDAPLAVAVLAYRARKAGEDGA